jgi:hypothetical protein
LKPKSSKAFKRGVLRFNSLKVIRLFFIWVQK